MALLDCDVIGVLENVLPARFGGGPTDYQLVEDADGADEPRLRLRVHPSVGPLDPGAVAEAFLTAVGDGSGPTQIAQRLWRDGRFLTVERAAPEMTAAGKLPLVRHRRQT
jgi:hypothetical protein